LVANAAAPCCMPVFNLTTEMLKVNISSTTDINPIGETCAICNFPILCNPDGTENADNAANGKRKKTDGGECTRSEPNRTLHKRIFIDSCEHQAHWFHAECAWVRVEYLHRPGRLPTRPTCPTSNAVWSDDILSRLCDDASTNRWNGCNMPYNEGMVQRVRDSIRSRVEDDFLYALGDMTADVRLQLFRDRVHARLNAVINYLIAAQPIAEYLNEQPRPVADIVFEEKLTQLFDTEGRQLAPFLDPCSAFASGTRYDLLVLLLTEDGRGNYEIVNVEDQNTLTYQNAMASLNAWIDSVPNGVGLQQLEQCQRQSLVTTLVQAALIAEIDQDGHDDAPPHPDQDINLDYLIELLGGPSAIEAAEPETSNSPT